MKNLGPVVTNELLFRAFGIFGTVESAKVFLNEKGDKSKGEGVIEFTTKHGANDAIMACNEAPFVLTSSPIPVIVEPYEVRKSYGLQYVNFFGGIIVRYYGTIVGKPG